jgi:hypothetical protein
MQVKVKSSAMEQNEFLSFNSLNAATIYADRLRRTGVSVCLVEPCEVGYYVFGDNIDKTKTVASWRSVEFVLQNAGYQLT